MDILNCVLFVTCFCCLRIVAGEEAKWTSKLLTHPDSPDGSGFHARAVSQDGRGSLLVAVEKTGQPESSVALFKVDLSGDVVWTTTTTRVKGTPFDISVDETSESAFVVVSESLRTGNLGAHVIRFTNIFASNVGQEQRIGEELFFSTPGTAGATKLFACMRHPGTGDLYVTGGTSASLYRRSLGLGDAIVLRLGSSGQVLATAQFGSNDDEVGRSIAISADGSALVAVTHRQFASGLSTSQIYRLDPQNLSIIDGPHNPNNHGVDPLFNPRSIAIAGPTASQPNTLITFVGGDALIRPDSQADVYIHIFAMVANRIREVTLTFDGAKKMKGIDSCVSANIGSDGNLYCLGYTEMNTKEISRRLHLIVVSPTGDLLLETERVVTGSIPLEETPAASAIMESGNNRKIVYVGGAKVSGKTEPTIGFIEVPRGSIRTFAGFHDIVTGAGTNTVPTDTTSPSNSPSDPPSIAVIAGGAAGGLAVLVVVIAGFVAVDRKRRLEAGMSRTTRTTATDYSREVDESFNDALTPRQNSDSGGALV